MNERQSRTEGVLRAVDWWRELGGLLFVMLIGGAAILAGEVVGWALGVVLLVLCAAVAIRHARRIP